MHGWMHAHTVDVPLCLHVILQLCKLVLFDSQKSRIVLTEAISNYRFCFNTLHQLLFLFSIYG
jgi:hypothetical protein